MWRCLFHLVFRTSLLLTAITSGVMWAAPEDFLVRSWHSEDGLPSNNVRSIAQSTDGYLWVATAEGVVRFDGVRFSAVGDARDEALFRAPRAVFALPDGSVWIATRRGGLLRWRHGHSSLVWQGADEEPTTGQIIREVLSDGAGGAFLLSEDTTFHAQGDDPPRALPQTSEWQHRVDQARHSAPRAVSASTEGPLELVDQHQRRWTRTAEGGLAVLSPGQDSAVVLAEFTTSNRVMALMEDREGNVWAATNGGGLRQIRERRVTILDATEGNAERHFITVMEDREGQVWAANKTGGISRIRPGHLDSFPLGNREADRNVSAMVEDAEGNLWVSKNNGAMFRREGEHFTAANGESPVFRRTMAMTKDAKGRLWLGGLEGLAHWEGGKVTTLDAEEGLPREQVTALVAAADNKLWVGMASGRVFRGDEMDFISTEVRSTTPVSAILPDAADTAWVATTGDGLYWVEQQRVSHFSKAQGLPDPRLTCVLDVGMDHLWLGSLSGIFRVAKADLRAIADHRARTATWLHLDRADGLLSRECVGSTQPAGWRRRDGTLLFPTVNGIAVVDPHQFETNPVPPLIQMEEVRVQGESRSVQSGSITTGPGRTRLELRFTALSFAVPEKVQFKTRLLGLDTGWQDIGTQRMVAYEAVPPGEYVFQVEATNNDGVWSEAPATLAIRVQPHFWQTLWFQSIAALSVVGLAFGIGVMIARARSSMKLLRLEAQTARLLERERIAQDLHDDLGASLTEISLLAGLAAEETNAKKQQHSIPTIASKAQYLVSTLDEIVWAVNPRHDTLASFVEYLSASASELVDTAGIALRLEIDSPLDSLPLDAVHRHALFLAAREALNNAVKHSRASEVTLSIHLRDGGLLISIHDNGHGFATEPTSLGDGLRNMQTRLENMGGQCRITSDSTGTVVTLELRIVQAPVS